MNWLTKFLKNFVFALCQDAPTRTQMNRYKLANGEYIRIAGGPVGQHRRQIIITNEDNANKLAVVEGNAVDPKTITAKGLTVFVNSSVTMFTNADVFIKATDGAISEVQVYEVYYTGL